MKYVLTCGCGSTDFAYRLDKENNSTFFQCRDCNEIYTEEKAGNHLLADI